MNTMTKFHRIALSGLCALALCGCAAAGGPDYFYSGDHEDSSAMIDAINSAHPVRYPTASTPDYSELAYPQAALHDMLTAINTQNGDRAAALVVAATPNYFQSGDREETVALLDAINSAATVVSSRPTPALVQPVPVTTQDNSGVYASSFPGETNG